MAKLENINNIDMILTYILVKKLVTPIVKTDAYKLGLVDLTGRIVKEPSNEIENRAMTTLDKVVFKLKRLLGSKLLTLNQFLYLQNLSSNFYDKLTVKGSITQRAEIKRIVKDIQTIQEKYKTDVDDLVYSLLVEEIEGDENANKTL